MRWIKRFVWFCIIVVVVGAVSILFLPAERLARIATDQLSEMTGREVSIQGEVGLTLWPVLGLRAEGLTVGGPDWGQGPLLTADRAALGVDARSLLGGDIRIARVEAERPVIRLERKADGRASWVFGESPSSGEADVPAAPQGDSAPAGSRSVVVEQVRVSDARVVFLDEGRAPLEYGPIDLRLDWPDPAGAAQFEASVATASAPITAEASIEGFAGFLRGDVQSLRAAIETGAGALTFDGRGGTAGELAGNLTLSAAPLDDFFRALALPAPGLPAALSERVDASTALTLTPDLRVSLRDLTADLGGTEIAGGADLQLGDIPQVTAQLTAGFLDFSGPGANAAPPHANQTSPQPGSSGAATTGWPTDSIDASALAAFNGEIALDVAGVAIAGFRTGRARAVLRNEAARLVVDLRDLQAYGGTMTGEMVVNNRAGLSVGGRINATAVEMQDLLQDALGVDRITGQAALSLSFLGAGPSVDAIMKSLSGDGTIGIGRGSFQGMNLDRLMRGGDVASGTTIFDSLTGTWTIADGVLSNDDLLLQLRNYEARGAGRVGLGTQTIDYTFTPVALRANSGQGLSIPILFKGPWSDVSIRPDLEAAFDLSIDAEVDRLGAAAKEEIDRTIDDAVDRQIGETLGVTRQEGQSTEDAVKEEIQNRLLRKLFD